MKKAGKFNLLVAIIATVVFAQNTVFAQPPGQATDPVPINSGVQIKVNIDLSWTAGAGAESHDVYFGTNPTPGATESQGNQTETIFDPGGLDYNTIYYWRIDEVNTSGTTTGDVWSFTTRPEPMQMPGFHLRGGMFLRPDGHWNIDSPQGFRDLAQMKRLGCGWMSVHINEHQDDAATIAPWYHKWTHYPAEIEAAVQQAQQMGMKTIIRLSKPQAWENALDEGKEEMLDPEGWFASYENYANKYAELAEDLGIDLFAIGSELHDAFLQGHDNEWTSIINGVRARYSGPLFFTIAGNGFLKNGNNVPFWDELDYIGINAYFKLTMIDTETCVYTEAEGDYNPTVQELMDQYNCVMNNIQDFRVSAGLTDMPVIFGEGGYRSTDGCNMKIKTPPVDLQEQADCINAMYSQAPRRSWWKGMNYWKFSTINGEGGKYDISQGVRGKKAQDHFVHNNAMVDHFDHYGHAESEQVADNWTVNNGTATLSLESTTVHGGDYAMKVDYDTTSTYLKFERALAEATDWSGTFSHLIFWFQGDSARAGDDLTLKVIGPTGLIGEAVYTGGAGLSDWTRWEIDLNSDITGGTGDLTSIKALRFQIPGGGGAGVLYLDEIVRLPLKAVAIHPFDGDTNVCPDDDIFWRSGHEAGSHNVYFGFNYNNVLNATTDSDEFLGNTSQTSVALGTIDNNKTCYWRVDEIQADENVVTGDVWSFTTGTYYISSGDFEGEELGDDTKVRRRWQHVTTGTMTTTVDGTEAHSGSQSLRWDYDSGSGACAVEHNRNTGYQQWQRETTGLGCWLKGSGTNDGDVTLEVELWDETVPVQKTFTNATQNSSWTWIGLTESDFTPSEMEGVRKFRITIPQASGANGTVYIDDVMRLTGKAVMPTPADNAGGVDHNQDLRWARGTDADSHDVYLGTDQTAVANATTASPEYQGNVTGTKYHLRYEPGTLSDETTYYWRVDTVQAGGTIKGGIWTFTTGTGGGQPGQTYYFNPTDDSYCKQNSATTNYGTNEKLAVRNESTGAGLRSFLKFTVSGLTEGVYSAKLKLYSSTVAANVMAHGVDNTTWTEGNITWSNMPALGTLLDTLAVSPDAWYEFDVTSHVTGNGTFSFGLDIDYTGGDWYHFNSKEASNIPVLEVTESTGGEPDTDPPTPDPMSWETVPYATGQNSISMTATTASDPSGVEYYFTCTAGGGNDSIWQDSTTYEDTGLQPGTQYTYTVKARDKSANQNETAASTAESATTDAGCTATDCHVESIVCEAISGNPPLRYGQATVTIYDDCGNPVVNALVDGTFTGDFNETIYDVATDGNGVAVFTTSTQTKKPEFTFCVDDVTHTLPYDSNDNIETCDTNY